MAAASAKNNMGPHVSGTSIVAMDLVLSAWLREPFGGSARWAIARTVGCTLGFENHSEAFLVVSGCEGAAVFREVSGLDGVH